MDNVDRMYRHLVRTIRSRFPQYLSQPFDVSELYQTILPYRHHRRELGVESNEDYEITLTELLSGAHEYLIVDDRMRDVLRAELASVNPDPAAFKQFADTMVALAPAAVRSLDAGPADELSPPRSSAPVPRITPVPAVVPPAPAPMNETAERSTSNAQLRRPSPAAGLRPSSPGITMPGSGTITPQAGDTCPACDEALPPGRPITFCPHCGQNITMRNCPACGSELEVGWKFCPACGRPAAAH